MTHCCVDAEVYNAAEAVKNVTISPPPAAPTSSQASPQKDKDRGNHHDEDDEQEEDQEARNKELQRIHEELQKQDNRYCTRRPRFRSLADH